jgi:membrane protein implicated in regulation of membrane protease activity
MDLTPLVWAILGVLMTVSEFIVPGFVIFFFGAGALLTALLTWLLGGLEGDYLLQIIIWLGASGLSLGLLRRYFARAFRGSEYEGPADDEVIGRQVRVLEAISPDKPGRVKFHGTSWIARSYDDHYGEGETVEILQTEGSGFVVTRSILGDDAPPRADDT